jgi:phage tail-like protein
MTDTPFTAFNFRVVINLDGESEPLCEAAFANCDGLEASVENQTIRAGGENHRQVHLGGPVKYGTVTLKRGMTADFGLWHWFERVNVDQERHLRATTDVVMLHSDRVTEAATFVLTGCLPIRLRVPGLDAATGQLAIEELQIAHETLRLRAPGRV